MSLASPLHLLALLALPLAVGVWALARGRRRRFALRHPAAATLAALAPRAARWRRILPVAMLGAAAALLAVAFARPQRTVAVPIDKASVALVTDASGSMQATDVAPTRLQAAQAAARAFLDEAPDGLLVGFSAFATSVDTNIPPTTDRDAVRDAIATLQADGGTATGDALSTALNDLEGRKGTDGKTAPAAIVLLSDGARTVGSDPLQAADRAKRLGIPVYTVALGTSSGTVMTPGGPVAVPPDPETLRQIAERSGGRAYTVDDADTLDAVYRELGSKIGTRREKRDVSAAFAGGALLLLVGGFGAGVRGRARLR